MSISTTAVGLDARIQNFRDSADLGGLQERARDIVTLLSERANKLGQVRKLMQCLGVEHSVGDDAVKSNIADFQQQLSQAGLKAVQRPTASDLSDSVRDFGDRTYAGGKKTWTNLFSGLTEDIGARVGRLGFSRPDRNAKEAHTKINRARLAYPVDHWEETTTLLGDDCSKWRNNIDSLLAKLIVELEKAETAVAQLPEEVQEFVAKAASTNGFPLKDLTAEFLDQLRDIGIIDDYTVTQT